MYNSGSLEHGNNLSFVQVLIMNETQQCNFRLFIDAFAVRIGPTAGLLLCSI